MAVLLSALDVLVLLLFLLSSASFGVYHALRGDRQRTSDEYLLANRNMHPIPVAISVVVTALSAVTYLGVPADVYVHGPQYAIVFFNKAVAIFFVVFNLCPVFHRLRVTSVYEYLQMRFDNSVRYACFGIAITSSCLFMGIAIYGPALALNAVIGISLSTSIFLSGLVCTFYSTIGGIKAVMWADVFQSMIMMAGFVITAIACCLQVGGFAEIFSINARDGRGTVFDFRLDPTIRHSFWAVFLGLGIQISAYIGSNQNNVQRYLTCRTTRQSQTAAGLGLFLTGIVELVAVITGMCVYAYYAGCDPLTDGKVQRADQLMVYIVADLFRNVPGMTGFLISAVFSASLSTVSSGINAVAAMVSQDILKVKYPSLQGMKLTITLKVISLIFGFLAMTMAFVASTMGAILPFTLTLAGITTAPIFGIFCLGMFVPRANAKGALVGLVTAILVAVWKVVGSTIYPPFNDDPPLYTDECESSGAETPPTNTNTSISNSSPFNPFDGRPSIAHFYSVSYAYYGLLTVSVILVVGTAVSWLTNPSDPDDIDTELLSPLVQRLYYGRKSYTLGKKSKNNRTASVFPPDAPQNKLDIDQTDSKM